MDRFDVERSYVMKKHLTIHLTPQIFLKKLTSSPVLSIILTLVAILHFATPPLWHILVSTQIWVPRDQPKPGYFLEGGRERTLGTRLARSCPFMRSRRSVVPGRVALFCESRSLLFFVFSSA